MHGDALPPCRKVITTYALDSQQERVLIRALVIWRWRRRRWPTLLSLQSTQVYQLAAFLRAPEETALTCTDHRHIYSAPSTEGEEFFLVAPRNDAFTVRRG